MILWARRSPKKMNLPNRLTLYRIALAVIFLLLIFLDGAFMKFLALMTFLAASVTDYWDGRIARETNQITAFGQLMDPIADKMLTLSAYLAFVQLGIIPAWMVVAVITRDLLVTGLRLLMTNDADAQSARSSGKNKTVLQFASIVGVLIFLVAQELPYWRPEWTLPALQFIYFSMLFIVTVTLTSGIWYVIKNREVFGAERPLG